MIHFWQDKRGSVAVIFAVSAMLLVVIAGAAVDFATAYYVRSSLQNALDSAALAAGRSDVDPDDTTEEKERKLTAEAKTVFDANLDLSPKLVTVQPLQVSYTPPVGITPDTVLVSMSASIPTTFLRIVGIPQFNLTVNSISQRPQPGPIDLALVLDTTGSMNATPAVDGVEPKITTLRTAAKELVERVMARGSPNIQVGVVPYANYVNVGLISPTPSWILPIVRIEPAVCTKRSTTDCTDKGTYDCPIDGVMKKDGCGTKFCACLESIEVVYPWNGLVGARSVLPPNKPRDRSKNDNTDKYLDTIKDLPTEPSTTIPVYSGQNDVSMATIAAPARIRPLTSNKADVLSTITALKAYGETHIPAGLIWGWNILAPGEPYAARTQAQLDEIGGRKVLLLMTDGINANSPRLWDGAILPHASASHAWRDGTLTDQLTEDICNNIRADGIQIFTVLFDVPEGSKIQRILNGCASPKGTDPEVRWSFNAKSKKDLLEAFRDISNELDDLKLLE
jgi:Flp pilus assembly protein TadG